MSARNRRSAKAARREAREERHERRMEVEEWRVRQSVCTDCGRYPREVWVPSSVCGPCLEKRLLMELGD